MENCKNIALVFAGGTGSRMKNASKPKQFLELEGKAVIIHTLLNFEKHEEIDAISVVCIEEWIEYLKNLISAEGLTKVKWIVPGGPTGQQSIYNGVKAVYDSVESPENVIILINDGVRPLVERDIISKNIQCVKENGTSATSSFVTETIIEINDDNKVVSIPNRKYSMASKAPQGFWLDQLMDTHQKAIKDNKFDCTNSIELMAYYGYSIYVVEDTPDNIKITTPIDFYLFKAIKEKKKI